MVKRSKLLLAAAILGSAYAVYLIWYFMNANATTEGFEAIGVGLATALVMPHMVCTFAALVFNWIGYALNARWSALVAGIMYAVAMVCMFMYALFVLLQMIFCFVAFAKMKTHNTAAPSQV